jgi:hypothetical protein
MFESTDLDAVPGSTTTSTASTESGDKDSDSAGPTPSEEDSASTGPTNTDAASAGASGGDDGNDGNNGSASTNGGLSQASTIAIAVVIPVLAVLAALGFFLWWRSRRALGARSQEVSQDPMSIHPDLHTPPGQPGYYSGSYAKPMSTTSGPAELSSEYTAAELSTIRSPHEMPLNGKQRHEMW